MVGGNIGRMQNLPLYNQENNQNAFLRGLGLDIGKMGIDPVRLAAYYSPDNNSSLSVDARGNITAAHKGLYAQLLKDIMSGEYSQTFGYTKNIGEDSGYDVNYSPKEKRVGFSYTKRF